MESVYTQSIASRGWHVYGKTSWKNPKTGQKVFAEKEKDRTALLQDPYAVAWKLKLCDKLTASVVGHVPREISRAISFFLDRGGIVHGIVTNERYQPSPIPRGGYNLYYWIAFYTLCVLNTDTNGPKYGYFPKAAKTALILKREEDPERAKDLFKNVDIKITTDGQRHLGAVLGSNDLKVSFVHSRVEKWVQDVEKLAEFAFEEPQAALSPFTKGLCHRWTYLQRTVPDTSELFEPLEKAISTKLIPAILGRDISDIERRLIALPLQTLKKELTESFCHPWLLQKN
eukprot:gene1041-368_t